MCSDNKHQLKVWEPGFLMATTERERRVLVRAGTTFEVDNHYFTKFSIIPSVLLVTDITDSIQESGIWSVFSNEVCMWLSLCLHWTLMLTSTYQSSICTVMVVPTIDWHTDQCRSNCCFAWRLTYRLSLCSKNSVYHHILGTFRWNRLCQLSIWGYSAYRVNAGKRWFWLWSRSCKIYLLCRRCSISAKRQAPSM